MTRNLVDILLIIIIATVLLLLPFKLGEQNQTHTEPPLSEPEDEPAIPEPAILATSTQATTTNPNIICTTDCPLIEVEQAVRLYYHDVPELIEVARCESTFNHWDEYGNVLMNKQGSSATGVMQLMASYHAPEAKKLGLDIRDFYGNLAYAKHLYQRKGLQPWTASKKCWGSAIMALNNTISGNEGGVPYPTYGK